MSAKSNGHRTLEPVKPGTHRASLVFVHVENFKLSTHGNDTHDVITPLAALIREIARTHDNQHLCTTLGSERAALQLNVGLAARGYALERLWATSGNSGTDTGFPK